MMAKIPLYRSQEAIRGGRIQPSIHAVQGLEGRAASHCCLNRDAKAEEAFTENECGIKAEPHIFKAGGIDPMLAFCGDGSAPRQVTDEDVILRSDGWWCGTETIPHCTLTELLLLTACLSTSKHDASLRRALIQAQFIWPDARRGTVKSLSQDLRRRPD